MVLATCSFLYSWKYHNKGGGFTLLLLELVSRALVYFGEWQAFSHLNSFASNSVRMTTSILCFFAFVLPDSKCGRATFSCFVSQAKLASPWSSKLLSWVFSSLKDCSRLSSGLRDLGWRFHVPVCLSWVVDICAPLSLNTIKGLKLGNVLIRPHILKEYI